jgi:tRNA-splicing endonuclease subunit Sen15
VTCAMSQRVHFHYERAGSCGGRRQSSARILADARRTGLAVLPECKRKTKATGWKRGRCIESLWRASLASAGQARLAGVDDFSAPLIINRYAIPIKILPYLYSIISQTTTTTTMTNPPTPSATGTLPPKSLVPHASALQLLFESYRAAPDSPHPDHLYNLALQIAHNLRHQHNWTDVRVYTHSPSTQRAFSRPLISGLPPVRLYVHPDEQITLLQRQKDAGKTGMPELHSEREWVLPSHLREKWSLKRFGQVFDDVTMVPTTGSGKLLFEEDKDESEQAEADEENEWRKTKRLLLATLDDDSTVVYYIVHDGIVKPRQN